MKLDEYVSHVPWDEVKVASGKASHVPEALIGLLSPDEETQGRSYWQLDNEVVLQSDLYEAAYYVVPILEQMLRERVAHGRARIYDLLYEIAKGHAPPTVVCRSPDGSLVPLREACAQELKNGLAVFERDAADDDPQVRSKSRELVEALQAKEPCQNGAGKSPLAASGI